MEENNLKYAIEAILFATGEPISLNIIAQAIETSSAEAKKLLTELQSEYDAQSRGIRIMQMDNKFQMVSRNEYFDYIKKILHSSNTALLSQAALETLSIVAYKQPVTRAEIEYIRGVQSSSSLDLLVDRGFVKISGKLDAPGKPLGYETTEEFLKLMNISSIDEMPDFEEFNSGIQLKLEENPAYENA